MIILDWVFTGLLSGAILGLILFIVYLSFALVTKGKVKKIDSRRRPKDKRKRKKMMNVRRRLQKKGGSQLRSSIIFLVICLLLSGGAGYARYYQMTNLDDEDANSIVQGYYLLNQTEEQLNNIANGDRSSKSIGTLREYAARLAGYGVIQSGTRLGLDGQQLLNRYYNSIKTLGLNLANQSQETLDEDMLSGFVDDIAKTKAQEKKVMEHFSISESALQQNK